MSESLKMNKFYKAIFVNRNTPDITLSVPKEQKSTGSDIIVCVFVCVDVLKGFGDRSKNSQSS